MQVKTGKEAAVEVIMFVVEIANMAAKKLTAVVEVVKIVVVVVVVAGL